MRHATIALTFGLAGLLLAATPARLAAQDIVLELPLPVPPKSITLQVPTKGAHVPLTLVKTATTAASVKIVVTSFGSEDGERLVPRLSRDGDPELVTELTLDAKTKQFLTATLVVPSLPSPGAFKGNIFVVLDDGAPLLLRFRTHLRTVRMRAAAIRFAAGGATVQEVAASVGYAHLADFDHHFKAHFGVTPSTYRAQLSISGASTIPAKAGHTAAVQQPTRTAVSFTSDDVKPVGLDSSGKAHVLIVEDDRNTGHAFGRILTGAGYDVAVAADTTAGRRLFQKHSPPVTIAGSAMKPTGILSFVRRVRERCTSRQSLALVTADAVLTEDQERELTDLRVTIAVKPLLPREILGLVSRLLVAAS